MSLQQGQPACCRLACDGLGVNSARKACDCGRQLPSVVLSVLPTSIPATKYVLLPQVAGGMTQRTGRVPEERAAISRHMQERFSEARRDRPLAGSRPLLAGVSACAILGSMRSFTAIIEQDPTTGLIPGLTQEVIEKLEEFKPRTIGEAKKIPGMTPAATVNLHVYMKIQKKKGQDRRSVPRGTLDSHE